MTDRTEHLEIPDDVDAIRFHVRGRVQGVCFRWFGRDTAEDLGLSGWIRNRADGSVEGEAFGPANALSRFIESLRLGPEAARVDGLDWQPSRSRPPTGFDIRT